ncbi:DUF7155 family protein [Mycolicibacterium sp. XJ1819]
MLVASTNIRVRRLVAVGALSVAAVAAPLAAWSLTSNDADSGVQAAPACLAWFGNKEDGRCLSYSNGYPVVGGTPSFGFGPNGVSGPNFSTGPMLPGMIIDRPIA